MSEDQTPHGGYGGRKVGPGDLLKRSESVIHAELDKATVMVDLDIGRYYELDPVGHRIWQMIETESSVACIRDALLAEYAVDGQTCLTDLLAFAEKLAGLGIVRVRSATNP